MTRLNTWEECHTLKLGLAMIKTKGVDSVQFKGVSVNEEAALLIVRSIKFKENYLKRLNLRNCRLGDSSGEVILKYLRDPSSKIETLKLGANGLRNTLSVVSSVLKVNRILEDLDLSSNLFEPAGFKVFESGFGSLRRLDVSQNELRDIGLLSFAEGLKSNTTLQWLGIEDIEADRKGLSRLFDCLEQNTTLETLYLGKNSLEGVQTESLAFFGRTCSSLVSLDCNSSKIGEAGACGLFMAFAEKNKLRELDMGNNGLTSKFCEDSKDSLKLFDSLTRLCLSYNDLTDSGVKAICDALRVQNTLESLDLTSNEITDVGVGKIAEFMGVDSALKELVLYRNTVTARGAKLLAKALEKNHGVQILDVGSNLLQDEGVAHLAKSLKKNTSLTVLNLDNNKISSQGLQTIVKCLEHNRSIIDLKMDVEGREQIEQQLDANLEERQRVAKRIILSTMGNIEKVKWNRLKLMVVGNANSGKTSLVRSLLDKVFSSRMPKTTGAEIRTLHKSKVRDCWERVNGPVYSNDFEHIVTQAAALQLKRVRSQVKQDHKSLSLTNLGKIAEQKNVNGSIKSSKSMKDTYRTNRYTLLRNKTLIQKRTTRKAGDEKLTTSGGLATEGKSATLHNQPNILRTFEKRLVEKVLDPQRDISNEHYPLTLSLWDFSGDRAFHPLVQAFMTANGGCLVVFDLTSAIHNVYKSGISAWLHSISLRAHNNHVFIVGTHSSEVDIADLEVLSQHVRGLVTSYKISSVPNSEMSYFPVDNKTGAGIKELQKALHDTLRNSSFHDTEVPLKWVRCFELMVRDRPGSWLRLSLVTQIAMSCNITKPEEVDDMLDLFSNLGVVAHVRSTEGLRKYVLTDPQWLLGSFAKMINPELSANQEKRLKKHGFAEDILLLRSQGLVSRGLMGRFFHENEMNFLIDFLERLLLLSSWRFGDIATESKKRYFLPTMSTIKDDPAAMKWPSKRKKLAFDFNEFGLPAGVFERLVALTVGFSSGIEKVPEPQIGTDICRVWLGLDIPVVLCKQERTQTIEMSVLEKGQNPSRAVELVRSMMSKIKEDVFGERLKWKLVYIDSEKKRLSKKTASASKDFSDWFRGSPEHQVPQRHVDLEVFLEVL